MAEKIVNEETDTTQISTKLRRFKDRAAKAAKGEAQTQAKVQVRDDSLGAHLAEMFLGRARKLETHQTGDLDSALVKQAEHIEVSAIDAKTGEEIGEAHTEGSDKLKMRLKETSALAGLAEWFQNLFQTHASSQETASHSPEPIRAQPSIEYPANDERVAPDLVTPPLNAPVSHQIKEAVAPQKASDPSWIFNASAPPMVDTAPPIPVADNDSGPEDAADPKSEDRPGHPEPGSGFAVLIFDRAA